jgi:hypothetical protein
MRSLRHSMVQCTQQLRPLIGSVLAPPSDSFFGTGGLRAG